MTEKTIGAATKRRQSIHGVSRLSVPPGTAKSKAINFFDREMKLQLAIVPINLRPDPLMFSPTGTLS